MWPSSGRSVRNARDVVRSPFVATYDCLTFLTDYGVEDGFVAACPGVAARISPGLRLIDITHLGPPGEGRRGAAVRAQTLPYLPPAVHVAVVDPGVGTARRGVAVAAGDSILIGPDNGLLSWAVAAQGGASSAYQLTNGEMWLHPVSPTFHGRDIFTPVAAHLAAGADLASAGSEIDVADLVTLPAPTSRVHDGEAEGEVMSVDRFGNVQLSIAASDADRLGIGFGSPLGVRCGRRQLTVPYLETFAAVAPGEIVAFTDSAGLISLAVNAGDAAQQLGLPPGAHVRLSMAPPSCSGGGRHRDPAAPPSANPWRPPSWPLQPLGHLLGPGSTLRTPKSFRTWQNAGVVDHEKVDAAARRLPRRATAAAAAGLAVACVVLTAAPAVADQVRSQEWWLSALHVTTAQESSKGSGVTVAVLDTGVDPTQPDLAGSVTTGPDYTGSGRAAGSPFWGIHGTAIASLIAGHGHGTQNGDGIIGVAPAAKILSVRVTLEGNDPNLTKAGVAAGLPADIAEGIRYAVGHGAQVIDLPLDPAALAATTPGGSTAARDAVAYALSQNVVLVAPGGDGGTGTDTVNYPAAYPSVISVGAFNQSFTKAPFTSRRPYVTLTAAGDGVIAATPSGYAMLHSTSAASAVVAGIAALIRAQFPTLSPAQVTSALTQSTVFRPPDGLKNGSGHGTADAQAALLAAAHIDAAVPAHSGSGGAVVAPSSPVVHPRGTGISRTVRYAALGLAALLVLGLLGSLLAGRARRRRARAARLAPLRAVSRVAVRAQPEF